MKLIAILLSLLLAAPTLGKERVEQPTLLKPGSPFTAGGIVEMKELDLLTKIQVNRVENGEVNGVPYSIYYTDGSGTFLGTAGGASGGAGRGENWTVACKKDQMTDKASCYLHRKDLWVWLHDDGKLRIFIGGEQYPNTSASVRVDSLPPVSSPADNEGVFTPAQAKQILLQLKQGERVYTRYTDWPYRAFVDDSFDLYGFDEAYDYLKWALQQIH